MHHVSVQGEQQPGRKRLFNSGNAAATFESALVYFPLSNHWTFCLQNLESIMMSDLTPQNLVLLQDKDLELKGKYV